MRLLFLSMHYRPEPCDTRTSELAAALAAKGHQSTALTSFPNYPYGRVYDGYRQRPWRVETIDGVKVIRVPMFPDHSRSAKRRALSYLSFWASASSLGPALARRPDLLWIHHPPLTTAVAGAWLARLMRVPFVLEIQDIWPETLVSSGMVREGRLTQAVSRVCRSLYRRAGAIVVTSTGMADNLARKGVPESKVHVLPQWADEEIYRPLPRDEEFGERFGLKRAFNVMFAGNIGAAQNLETMVQAAALLRNEPDVRFVVLGDGLELARLRQMVDGLGLENVSFLGQHPKESMPMFFAWADALLLHLRDDPLFSIMVPNKVQAYMACGRPLLCAMKGDAAAFIAQSEAGVVTSPEDPRAMADGVLRLKSASIEERERMGAQGRRAFERLFAKEVLVDRYEALFHSLLAGKGSVARSLAAAESQTVG